MATNLKEAIQLQARHSPFRRETRLPGAMRQLQDGQATVADVEVCMCFFMNFLRAKHRGSAPAGWRMLLSSQWNVDDIAPAGRSSDEKVWIGDGVGDRAALPNETPCHQLRLSSFLMDVEPVSVGAFARFLNQTQPPFDVVSEWCLLREGDGRSDYLPLIRSPSGLWKVRAGITESWPMIMVSWFGANAYSLWANGHDWQGYAQAHLGFLPTEAQWEYAARGADVASFPWGDHPASPAMLNVCWDMDALKAETALPDLPLASVNIELGVSQFGLRHMAGNVWQWCRDTYDPAFYSSAAASEVDGWNSAADGPKSERGGSWVGPAYLARSSYRRGRSGRAKGRCLGFRCVGNAKVLEEQADMSSADVSTAVSEDFSGDETLPEI